MRSNSKTIKYEIEILITKLEFNSKYVIKLYINLSFLRGRSHMTSSPRGGRGFPNDDD